MSSLRREKRHVNAGQLFADELQESQDWLLRLIGLRMTLLLSKAVDELLARAHYERRGRVSADIEGGECQRCIFHKLRNISKAIQLPDDLDPEERRRKRRAIRRDFKTIWQAKDYHTAVQRCWQLYKQYRYSQPAAVATRRRDLRRTLTYYHVRLDQPGWQRRFLRTTSRLGRFNRALRKRCRSAGAYHFDDGLQAMIAQTADQAFQAGTSARAQGRPISTERDTLPDRWHRHGTKAKAQAITGACDCYP